MTLHAHRATRLDPDAFLAGLEPSSVLLPQSAPPRPMTAIADFSAKQDNGEISLSAARYRGQIPLSAPGPGQQYAFEVDLDRCSGCKACVTACHSLNGLDEHETWRGVGLLMGGSSDAPVQQHVTAACHHCLEPACAAGCPVDAYEKDPQTGIVKHLDDQCIGCQYCTLKCPYDVPRYHADLGIVRKCDMCSDRLHAGEAPACVQACPTQAIRIVTVDKAKVLETAEASVLVPGAPASDYTQPTTSYISKKPLPPNTIPSDYHTWKPEHGHPPLVAMLVLSQLSVGAFCVDFLMTRLSQDPLVTAMQPVHSIAALTLGLLSLAAATFHLGRPQYAWRAVIGLRHSWLSREIVAFGLFATLAVLYAACFWIGPVAAKLELTAPLWLVGPEVPLVLGLSVAVVGLIGVVCSIMIYGDCNREAWRESVTGIKFLGSSLVLGLATVLFAGVCGTTAMGHDPQRLLSVYGRDLALLLTTVASAKLLWEISIFRHLRRRVSTLPKRTARLMATDLRRATVLRFVAGIVGGILLPALLLGEAHRFGAAALIVLCTAILGACLVGESAERHLFFTAVARRRMPGGAHA